MSSIWQIAKDNGFSFGDLQSVYKKELSKCYKVYGRRFDEFDLRKMLEDAFSSYEFSNAEIREIVNYFCYSFVETGNFNKQGSDEPSLEEDEGAMTSGGIDAKIGMNRKSNPKFVFSNPYSQ
jgi:hypothetical protein